MSATSTGQTVETCSRVLDLLESFARVRHYIPNGARRVSDSYELPGGLRSIAWLCERSKLAWEAWVDDVGIRFMAGELIDAGAPWNKGTKVRILFFDGDGRPTATGIWVQHVDGSWSLRHAS